MRHRTVHMHSVFYLITMLYSLTKAVHVSSNMLVAFSILPAKETESLIESWNCVTSGFFPQNIFKVLHSGEK